jgi:hypothetical protein
MLKWTVTVAAILFGSFFLGPWVNTMTALSGTEGMDALHSPTYAWSKTMSISFGLVQQLVLIATIYVSIRKPWKKRA